MYRMSIISMMCPDKSLDRDRCVKMALIHDMAESIVGDITPLDGVAKGMELSLRNVENIPLVTKWLN